MALSGTEAMILPESRGIARGGLWGLEPPSLVNQAEHTNLQLAWHCRRSIRVVLLDRWTH